jgi:hypothetical protein
MMHLKTWSTDNVEQPTVVNHKHVTATEIAEQIRTGHPAVKYMVECLGYQKVCAQWVPCILMEKHKLQQKNASSQQLEHHDNK